MGEFAKGTTVDVGRTLGDIQRELSRFKCEGFGQYQDAVGIKIGFLKNGLNISMEINFPDRKSFKTTSNYRERSEAAIDKCVQEETRRLMRSLLLVIKAKLVAVSDGVATFEQEFMPYIVMSDGQTLSRKLLPPLLEMAKSAQPIRLALPNLADAV